MNPEGYFPRALYIAGDELEFEPGPPLVEPQEQPEEVPETTIYQS